LRIKEQGTRLTLHEHDDDDDDDDDLSYLTKIYYVRERVWLHDVGKSITWSISWLGQTLSYSAQFCTMSASITALKIISYNILIMNN